MRAYLYLMRDPEALPIRRDGITDIRAALERLERAGIECREVPGPQAFGDAVYEVWCTHAEFWRAMAEATEGE